MSNLTLFTPQPAMRRSEARQLSRSLGTLHAQTNLQLARIEQAAEVQAHRADAVTYVGKRAMHNVAMVSQVEASLATLVPHASGRLAVIADLTALALSDVVSDTLRQVR